MSKAIKRLELFGILFTMIAGTLLHFLYRWSGNNRIVALFSPINESTWEHLKLLFFPFVIYSIFEFFVIGHIYSNFITAKVLGVIAGLISIPIIFYSYITILGDHNLILDILTFLLSVMISYIVSWYLFRHESITLNGASMVVLIFLILLFFVFTFNPPETTLFMDPLKGTYGIS